MYGIDQRGRNIWYNGLDKELRRNVGRIAVGFRKYKTFSRLIKMTTVMIVLAALSYIHQGFVRGYVSIWEAVVLSIVLVATAPLLVCATLRRVRSLARKGIRELAEARREGRIVERSSEGFWQLERMLTVAPLETRRDSLYRDKEKMVSAIFEAYFMATRTINERLSREDIPPEERVILQGQLTRKIAEVAAQLNEL